MEISDHISCFHLLLPPTLSRRGLLRLTEATSTGVEPLTAYETLARELNSILFSDSVTISTIPQFNRIILSGNSKYVDELLEYLELYRKNLTSEKLDSSRIRITYTLPENFFLVEDVLRLGSSSGSGLPGDGTIVGTILNLLTELFHKIV